ncbi:MAG: hypothetical protein AB8B93_01285 [Pseudomonadales bacterium]
MMRCLLLVLAAGLGGCVNNVTADADGVLSARCPDGGFSRCHNMAKRHCGKVGYRTLSEVSDTGSKSGGTGDSLITARAAVRILTFRCQTES